MENGTKNDDHGEVMITRYGIQEKSTVRAFISSLFLGENAIFSIMACYHTLLACYHGMIVIRIDDGSNNDMMVNIVCM